MKKLGLLLVAMLVLSGHGHASSKKPAYTMEISLHPIRMSITDLSSLLAKVNRFVLTSRAGTKESEISTINELALSDGVRRFQVSGDFSARTLESAPGVSYEASYNYRTLDGPITQVSIDLVDYRRKISISGYNQEHVEALAQLLSSYLQAYETYWGGFVIRFVGFFVFLIAGGAAGLVYSRHSVVKTSIATVTCFVLAFVILFNDSLTPGVVIYKGSPVYPGPLWTRDFLLEPSCYYYWCSSLGHIQAA
jgi:hypothetical protein